jgi:hypothetical protein
MRPAWGEKFDTEFADNIVKTFARVFGETPNRSAGETGA